MGKCFGSLLNVHNYYKYPGSYRHGTIYNENGVIRSYSNGTSGDYKENGYFYYNLKSDSIKSAFKIN